MESIVDIISSTYPSPSNDDDSLSVFSLESTTSVGIIDSIRERDWASFSALIDTPAGIEKVRGKMDPTKMSVLGMVLGCKAPYHIVKRVIDIHPNLLIQPDKLSALPIHIACLNGSSVEIIQLLVERGGIATIYYTDYDGRIPLHHAVEFAVMKRLPKAKPVVDEEEALVIVQYLYSIAADTVHHNDYKLKTPISIAHIFADKAYKLADLNWMQRIDRVISGLRHTSIQLYKSQQAQRELLSMSSPDVVNTMLTEDSIDSDCNLSSD